MIFVTCVFLKSIAKVREICYNMGEKYYLYNRRTV